MFPEKLPPPPSYPPPPFAINNALRKRGPENGGLDLDPYLDQSQAIKKSRNLMNNGVPLDPPPSLPRANPPNPLANRGTGHLFYKTRMCAKFSQEGSCRNGESCNFAHGVEDMREPQPNWQEIVGRKENVVIGSDDQRSGNRYKICKKYANGEECPYGDSCNFLHKRGAMSFDAQVEEQRESSVIRIGTTATLPFLGTRNVPNQVDVINCLDINKQVNSQNLDAYRVNMKPAFWKTKICTRWEVTGNCLFGEKCHFAHGEADLKLPGEQMEAEVVAGILSSAPAPKPVLTLPTPPPPPPPPATTEMNTPLIAPEENRVMKFHERCRGPKKINGIYGDWLEGLEPPRMYPKNYTES